MKVRVISIADVACECSSLTMESTSSMAAATWASMASSVSESRNLVSARHTSRRVEPSRMERALVSLEGCHLWLKDENTKMKYQIELRERA